MRTFLQDAPPVLWTALIVLLFAFSQWLTEYFGAVDWVKSWSVLLIMVLIPTLRIIFPDATAGRMLGEVSVPRSRPESLVLVGE